MKHILFIFLLFVIAVVQSQNAVKRQAPNIIYILADDMGYGDVKSFNSKSKIPTPNLDDMAENGVKFIDAHTSSSVCTPTRYGILTGRYSWRTSLKSSVLSGFSKSLIKQDRTTVAEMLKSQGYKTAFIGKWHLGWDWNIVDEYAIKNLDNLNIITEIDYKLPIKNGPATHGFDYSFGFCGSLDMPPYVYVENDLPTMEPTKSMGSGDAKTYFREGPTSEDFNHASVLQDLTNKAVNYIHKNASSNTPFFLYFPLPAPHTPILPTTEFLGKSNTNMYGDFVMQVDDVVRQIREVLEHRGISENTLLVFTSDNGCSPKANFQELAKVNHNPNYMFRGAKADIFEGGHHVPFIIEWPKIALKNSTSDKTICTTDFFATCAEIIGYQIPDNEAEDSFSMLPLISGETEANSREYTVHHSINGSLAIRWGIWKLIFCPDSGGWSEPKPQDIKNPKLKLPDMQLYNLKADIGETNNLVNVFPEKVSVLKAALKKIILDGRSTPGVIQKNDQIEVWKQIEKIVN